MERQAWRGAVGLVEVRFSEDKQGRHVTVWLVKEELGMVRQAGQGTIRKSAAGSGLAGLERLGWAKHGEARQAWLVVVWFGLVGFGLAGNSRRGTEGKGVVGLGSVRQARRGLEGHGWVRQAWLG